MPYVFSEKPYNWPTHRVDADKLGFVEHLEETTNQKLYVAHRLDKTTTGAMVFATTADSAKNLQEHFQNRNVKKEYYFVTDKKINDTSLNIESFITEKDKAYYSDTHKNPNSQTVLTWVCSHNKYHLWKAEPLSGKTHQIRLHAKDAGIPIVGDATYGGSDYPFLLLHSHKITVPDAPEHISPLPVYFSDLENLENPLLARSIRAIEDRILLFKKVPDCVRWIHKEIPWLCVDQLGDHLWFQIFETHTGYENLVNEILSYLKQRLNRNFEYHVQVMPNRGMSPNQKLVSDSGASRWQAKEHEVTYEFRSDSGSSYGLFLDQRKNRDWVLQNAGDKTLLNLFCYTGGFSLCALHAGAKEVTSVDTSKNTLEWLETNIKLNSFNSEIHKSWSTDARIFLKGAKQRDKQYDLVICDPPSFSRSKEGIFKIENDFKDLLDKCLQVLAPKGTLLFSTNFEGWLMADFKEQVEQTLPKDYKVLKYASSDVDYEPPTQNRILKMVFISKL
ncbi:MAG: class I SAM-dependent methyltransferase [Bdellovibrionales bacterium]|nr:class I SAM-dependent methyltransferase [Bdellovibrionales bacterium]